MKRNHRGLRAWQQAMELVESVYRHTADYPEAERYGIVSQMRRAAVSVPSNVAEGFARSGSKELLRFLSIASGSLSELDTLVELASRLQYDRQPDELRTQIDDVAGLIMGLSASIRRKT